LKSIFTITTTTATAPGDPTSTMIVMNEDIPQLVNY
jgi:hypothetical protein